MQPCGQRRRTTLDQVSGAAKVQATPNRACSWQSHPYIRKHSSQPSETLRPHLKCVIEPRLGALKLLSLVRQVSVLYLKDLMCYGGLNPIVVSCPYRSWSPTWRRLDYVPFLRIKKVGFVRFQINLLCRKCHSLLFGTLQKAHVTASSCWIWQSKLWEVTSWAFKCFLPQERTKKEYHSGCLFRVNAAFKAPSVDIKDLYYSLPHDTLLDSVEQRNMKHGRVAFPNACGKSVPGFLDLLAVYPTSTFVNCKENTYIQKLGIRIGSSIAPVLSDIFTVHFNTLIADRLIGSKVMKIVIRWRLPGFYSLWRQ